MSRYVSGQNKVKPVFWLAVQASKMGLSDMTFVKDDTHFDIISATKIEEKKLSWYPAILTTHLISNLYPEHSAIGSCYSSIDLYGKES